VILNNRISKGGVLMGRIRYIRLLLFASLLLPLPSWAVEIHGRSSTQFLSFINDFNNRRQVDIGEYLMFNATNIDKEGKFSITGYGRGVQDLNNGNGIAGRLYYLYGDYRDLYNIADIRVGQQFVNLSAGSAIIAGAQVNLKNIGPVGFTVLGGYDVVYGLTGNIGHEGNYDLGMAAYLQGFKQTQLDVSWFRKWDQGDVARDIVGANFNQYLLDRFRLYGNAQYDLTAEVFNQVLAGVKYFPTANLIFTGEWYQSYPTFDATDIYSVFAVDRYQEYLFRCDYTINQYVAVHGGYTRESFGDVSSGNGTANVYEAGVTLRPIDKLALDLAYDMRDGYGGRVNGGSLDASYDYSKNLQLGAGLAVDVFDRTFFPETSGNEDAQVYWLGGKYKLARNMRASLRVEDMVSSTRNSDVQGRFVFDYDF
jgi:hypothetical protein